MQEVYKKYEGRFNIIALSPIGSSGTPGGGCEFVFGNSAQADRLYDVRAVPHTVFIDAEGRLLEQHRGAMTPEVFETAVKNLLVATPNI